MSEPIRIGVVGCGRWGPNHVRNFAELEGASVTAAADLDRERLEPLVRRYPGLHITSRPEELVTSRDLDAVVVATPTATHYALTRLALESGKHVLCEKPICVHSDEAEHLVALSEQKRRILMIGHVFLYNSGIVRVKQLLRDRVCGDIRYVGLTRTNLGPIRSDVDVVYDLAAHDISIANYLLDAVPERVSATAGIFLREGVADVAFLQLQYPGGVLVGIHVSWLDPKKVRRMTIVGSDRMLTWNEFGSPGPIEIFDRKVARERASYRDYGEFQLELREGDVYMPSVVSKEPLELEAAEFLRSIRLRRPPLSDGKFGLSVLQVIEAAERSAAADSGFCEVDSTPTLRAAAL